MAITSPFLIVNCSRTPEHSTSFRLVMPLTVQKQDCMCWPQGCTSCQLRHYACDCMRRADPDKLQKRLQAFAQEEVPTKRKGRSARRASEANVLFRAMSLPSSAGLKLVGDPLVGRALEHQQLSMGGPVASTQVLHSRPELGGDEVTPPSSSSPGIFLGTFMVLLS